MSTNYIDKDKNGHYLYKCPKCGKLPVYPKHIFDCQEKMIKCERCNGTGYIENSVTKSE